MNNLIHTILLFSCLGWSINLSAQQRQFSKADSLTTNVVKITSDLEAGSGVIVGHEKDTLFIATAYHVVNQAIADQQKITVQFSRDYRTYPAIPINKIKEDLDLIVLKVGVQKDNLLHIDIAQSPSPGEAISIVGYPFGVSQINSHDNVVQKTIYDNDPRKIEITSLGITPGYSGGAIFNKRKELLGMTISRGGWNAIGISFSIIQSILEEWGIPTDYLNSLNTKIFSSKETYNILLLPFGVLGSCDDNGKTDRPNCARAVANRIVSVSEDNGLNIDVHILSGYNSPGYTLSYKEGKELGENYKADLVIWGDYEKTCDWDTTMINIRYVSLDNLPEILQPRFVGKRGETNYQPIRMLSELSRGKMTGDVESIVYWSLALKEASTQNYSTAIRLLQQIKTKEEQEYSIVFMILGELYYHEDQPLLAIQSYSKAIDLNPQDGMAYNNRGLNYYDLNHLSEALNDYNMAINIDPQSEFYINRGSLYDDLGRPEDALKDYNKSIILNPLDSKAFNNRGNIYINLNLLEKAISNFSEAIKLSPQDDIPYMNRGNAYKKMQAFQKALNDYNKAIELNPQNTKAICNRGNVFRAMGDFENAINDYNQAIKLDPQNIYAYNSRGDFFKELNQQDKAFKDYNKAIGINPDDVTAYNNRANLFSDIGRHLDALKDYTQIIKINPNDENHYYNRGETFFHLNRLDEALNDYNKAISFDPAHAPAYMNKGNILLYQKRYKEALDNYNKAIILMAKYTEAYYNKHGRPFEAFDPAIRYTNRGALFYLTNRPLEAIDDFTRAINVNPQFAEAYFNRGKVFQSISQRDKALIDYQKAIEINSQYAEAYSNRGIMLHEMGRLEEAMKDYDKVIEISPKEASVYVNRGLIFQDLNRFERALKDYNKAIAIDPQDADGYFNRGLLLQEMNKKAEALNDYNKALEINPQDAEAYFNRGNLFRIMQRTQEALSDYNKAIELNPKYAKAYNNRAFLMYTMYRFEEVLKNLIYLIDLEQITSIKNWSPLLVRPEFNPYRQDPRFSQIFELANE